MLVSEAIGRTPLIELSTGVDNDKVRLLGKLEGNNPAGSVKDRPARSMIMRAEERGELTAKGKTVPVRIYNVLNVK